MTPIADGLLSLITIVEESGVECVGQRAAGGVQADEAEGLRGPP